MGELVMAGVLTWLLVFVWWGMDLALRSGRRSKVMGACLIALALVPTLVALWLGT